MIVGSVGESILIWKCLLIQSETRDTLKVFRSFLNLENKTYFPQPNKIVHPLVQQRLALVDQRIAHRDKALCSREVNMWLTTVYCIFFCQLFWPSCKMCRFDFQINVFFKVIRLMKEKNASFHRRLIQESPWNAWQSYQTIIHQQCSTTVFNFIEVKLSFWCMYKGIGYCNKVNIFTLINLMPIYKCFHCSFTFFHYTWTNFNCKMINLNCKWGKSIFIDGSWYLMH